MSRAIKFRDNDYIDSNAITHKRKSLSEILNQRILVRNVGYNESGARWVRFMRVNLNQSWYTTSISGYVTGTINCVGAGDFYIKLYSNQLPAINYNSCFVGTVKGNFNADRIKGVIVASSTSSLTIDFYIYTIGSYSPFNVVLTSYDSKVDFDIAAEQLTALPSGTQIAFS